MLRKVLLVLLPLVLEVTWVHAQSVKFFVDDMAAEMVTDNGKKYIHLVSRFTVKGLENQKVKIGIAMSQDMWESDYSDENAKKTNNFLYREVFIPSNNERFDNFEMYIPFEQLRLLPGKHNYNVFMYLQDAANIDHIQTRDKRHDGKSLTFTLTGPMIKITQLQLSQNTYENGEYGLEVSYGYDTQGLKDKDVEVYAYLVDESADLVSSQSSSYSINGYVALSRRTRQPYESTTSEGSFFFPNSVISASKYGEHKYFVQLIVCDREKVNDLKDVRNSSWFYATRGEQYTSSSAKPKQNYSNSYASSSSSSSSSSSYSSKDNSSAIGLGILLGLGAIAVDALTSSNNSSSSSSSYSSSSSTSGKQNGHEWLDLGLPSGTKWATTNVGASYNTQYGDFFSWGEVWKKSIPDGFSMSNYRYYESVTSESIRITKFHNKDNLTTIYGTDDAADTRWGGDGSWQTPSREQFQELLDYCTWTWDKVGEVFGYKVKSKKNGKTLFFPAGGHIEPGYRGNTFHGVYMTRDRNPANNQRDIFVLFFDSSQKYVDNDWERSWGYMVRPVLNR